MKAPKLSHDQPRCIGTVDGNGLLLQCRTCIRILAIGDRGPQTKILKGLRKGEKYCPDYLTTGKMK
jgi:hypothetical protein